MKTVALAALLFLVAPAPQETSQQPPQPPQASRPRPVPTAEHRQFDFWLGDWEVTAGGRKAGTNVITSIQGGFAVHENWTNAGGGTGTSLNFFDRADGKWHQVWIDASGNALFLAGGLVDGKMVLQSAESGGAIQRVTWTPLEGATVRQLWETSADKGKTWSVVFDGHYTKRK